MAEKSSPDNFTAPPPLDVSSQDVPVQLDEKKAGPSHGNHKTRKMLVRRAKKKKPMSPLRALCAWLVEHQIGVSANLLILLALAHVCFPRARPRTRKFFEMQGYQPADNSYIQTWDDGYYLFFWIVVFTGLRVAVMDFLLWPLASWSGIRTNKGRTRFSEQGWLFLYYSASWSTGMYIYSHSPYWLNLKEMWTDYPARAVSPLMKWYYLVQTAFWLQQLFVVNIEERRKDHWQMFTHHIFTSILLFTSYGIYHTKVGTVILCIMDLCDIILPLAKLLNYLRFQTLCDIAFGTFLVTWLLTRHIAYLVVCYSIFRDLACDEQHTSYGCYDMSSSSLINGVGRKVSWDGGNLVWPNIIQSFKNPGGVVCYNWRIKYGFLGLLMALQVLTLIWFGMIVKVAYGVITGKGAQDSRSDDEAASDGDDGDEDAVEEVEVVDPVLEHSSAVLSARHKSKERERSVEEARDVKRASPGPSAAAGKRKGRGRGARASGISIPGHGDHKELLGRIGCDKPS